MTKGTSRQARLARQTIANQKTRRNRRIRSALSLIGAVVLSAAFYRIGVLHRIEPAFDQLEARLEETRETSDVAIVIIDDDDYQKLFQSKSPLDPNALLSLIDAIAAGRPKLIGVDIDTSDPQFKEMAIPGSWPPIIWHRSVKDNLPADIQLDRLRPTEILGGRDPTNSNSGLVLLIDTEDGVTRRYQRLVNTSEGPLPTFPWAVASRFDPTLTKTVSPSSDQLAIKYSRGANRFRFAASRVRELSKGSGWARQSPIEGRIVLLGGGFGSFDRHETPLGKMTGVEIMANAIETEVSRGGHHPPSGVILILLLTVEGLVPVLIFHKFESEVIKPLALSLAVMTLISLAFSILIYRSVVQLPYFLFMFFVILIYQGFETFRHRTIISVYEEATEPNPELGKHPR
jgi:CHASE2 domain-containing sensor protein